MIKINESNDWSGFKVLFNYKGDSLSDYQTTVIVKAKNKSDAIDKAKKHIKNKSSVTGKYEGAYNFRIDGEIKSYEEYKKKYPLSNLYVINESAEDAIILDKNNKHIVASQIALNLEGEWDAIDGYNKLIPWLEKYNDQESINHIREIISDEKNHAMLLRKIIKKYDGNIEMAKD